MYLKLILPAIAIISLLYLTTISSLNLDNDIFFYVYAQHNTLSDHELNGYLEQMIGHLEASIMNVKNNNNVLAVAHVLHPIEEIVDIINNRLIQTVLLI